MQLNLRAQLKYCLKARGERTEDMHFCGTLGCIAIYRLVFRKPMERGMERGLEIVGNIIG